MTRTEDPFSNEVALEHSIREAIARAPGCPTETLAVSVDTRRVALAGALPSRDCFEEVDRVLRDHAGAREVLNLTTISPDGHERDMQRARDMQGRLRTRFPDAAVRVAVLGDTAVVAGRAPSTRHRAEIATIAALEPQVERTVNQIECPR